MLALLMNLGFAGGNGVVTSGSGGPLGIAVTVEMKFAGWSGAWTDITEDVIRDPIVMETGIRGNRPDDRVAEAGTLSFGLNNGPTNSAATSGYYSPFSSTCRTGFTFNTPVRFSRNAGSGAAVRFVGGTEAAAAGSTRAKCKKHKRGHRASESKRKKCRKRHKHR